MQVPKNRVTYFLFGTAGLVFTAYVYATGDLAWALWFGIMSIILVLSPMVGE
jgi:hypothetical protein